VTRSARAARASDREAIESLAPGSIAPRLGDPEKFLVVVVEDDKGAIAGALAVDLGGKSTDPDTPDLFQIALREDAADDAWTALHDEAERLLRENSHARSGVAIEATDAKAIQRYEARGYEAVGGGAYREMGGGHVEYLHGYTDPVGFVVDFVKKLD